MNARGEGSDRERKSEKGKEGGERERDEGKERIGQKERE